MSGSFHTNHSLSLGISDLDEFGNPTDTKKVRIGTFFCTAETARKIAAKILALASDVDGKDKPSIPATGDGTFERHRA
jgi:hypothetical protein